MDAKELKAQIDILFAGRQYDEIEPLLSSNREIVKNDNVLATVIYLLHYVYQKEKEAGIETIFSKVNTVKELIERYTCLKFLLRRLDFDLSEDGANTLHRFLSEQRVSSFELITAVNFSVVHKDKVWREIKGE